MKKEEIKIIHEELNKAIEKVGKKYGFEIFNGSRITYSDIGFTFKTEVRYTKDADGANVDPNEREFKTYCRRYQLTPEDYKREVYVPGDSTPYEITGLKIKARKNTVIISNKQNGKKYVCNPLDLNDENGKMIVAGYHRCKYCGSPVPGETEDLLCSDCRESFGHALYSEL